jgi:hypothetical protein
MNPKTEARKPEEYWLCPNDGNTDDMVLYDRPQKYYPSGKLVEGQIHLREVFPGEQSEIEKLRATVETAEKVFDILIEETRGFIRAHEIALSGDGGNSNMSVMAFRLDEATKALAAMRAEINEARESGK